MAKKQPKQNVLKVYLIQRIADNKFFTDKTSWDPDQTKNWSDDKAQCRVFKSLVGAKTSRGWHDKKRVITTSCDNCSPSEQTIAWRLDHKYPVIGDTRYCHHYKYVKMDDNELPCRVIEVEVKF